MTILTQRRVETIKPTAKRQTIADGLIRAQYLIVEPSGAKAYYLFAGLNGKQVKRKVGDATLVSLAEARTEGRRLRLMIESGVDPLSVKRAPAATAELLEPAFRRFVERYLRPRTKTWRESVRLVENDVLPVWRDRAITDIHRPDIVMLLDRISDRAPIVSNRVLSELRRLFAWLCERGQLESNPCDRIRAPSPETSRDRVLNDAELALVWQAAGQLDPIYAAIVRLLILTGQRLREIAGMRWSEIDFEGGVWVLPSSRSKKGNTHTLPITDAMRDVLASVPRLAPDIIFPAPSGQRPVTSFSACKRRLDQLIAEACTTCTSPGPQQGGTFAPWVIHDLRRSTASGMAKLGTAPHVIEAVLNHKSGVIRGIAAVYNRFDYAPERREALERWSAHVRGL